MPNFLIIGAMKSGTTSLYRDLSMHPNIFVPDDKEPDALTSDSIFIDDVARAYEALFAASKPDQVCGEASTSYTKRPVYERVAERAARILGGQLRVIYIVRDPVDRIVSHYHHEYMKGEASVRIDLDVRRNPNYINFSRYMMQLLPWLQIFGCNQVKVIKFENYVLRRKEVVADVQQFIGVNPIVEYLDVTRNYNKSQGKPVVRGIWRKIYDNPAYRLGLRKLMPWQLRERMRHLVLPKGPESLRCLQPDTVEWLVDALSEDVLALSQHLKSSRPLWNRWSVDNSTPVL